jgi:uncharacterized protein (DUF362 family)
MENSRLSRRDFLRTTGIAALGIAGANMLPPGLQSLAQAAGAKDKSLVAAVTDATAVSQDWKINPAAAERMVNEAVMLLTQAPTPQAAWAALFPGVKSSDIVGIKVNTLNPSCPSHVEVAMAVAAGLRKAGFKENNIIIWDRAEGSILEGLTMAGYTINRGPAGVRCLGTNSPMIGYDQRNPVSIPSIQKAMPVSKLVSEVCRYLVNIPVLKHHCITGVTGCLKSYYGAIPLGDKVSLADIGLVHQNNGSPQIAELYANPIIKEKTRLHIADGLMGLYKGGPHGSPQWRNNQVLASQDPVALDYQLLQILNAMRKQKGEKPLDAKKTGHLYAAEKLGLGACTPALIEMRTKTLA